VRCQLSIRPTCLGEASLHFQLELNAVGIFKCPHLPIDANLKDGGRANVRAVLRKVFANVY
jgi:hypothetical protein